jgi:transposase
MEELSKKSCYSETMERNRRSYEIYTLYTLKGMSCSEIAKKYGFSRQYISKIICMFRDENPKIAEDMAKKGKDVTPDDYRALQEQILKLKSDLKKEKLRADFYEEMVSYGKEVYGIDLKKAGTR